MINIFILVLALMLILLAYAGIHVTLVLVCSFAASLFGLIPGFINYTTSEFGLTNRRVLIKTGFLRRQTLELNLGRIESFQVNEPILGRILGFNNLVLTGSGGTRQSFRAVANGKLFRQLVTEHSTTSEFQYPMPGVAATPTYQPQADPATQMAAQQYEYARSLWQQGKRNEARAILEMLAAQGNERAQEALRRLQSG